MMPTTKAPLFTEAQGLLLGRRGHTSARAMGFLTVGTSKDVGLVHYDGDGHLMTFGATGASKTAGPAICNALTHRGQLVSIECKGDIHAATAERRQRMGQQVHVLDMRFDAAASDSLNPVDLAKRSGSEISVLARSLAAAVVTRGPREDAFWVNWAETMVAGGLALKLETSPPEEHTFGTVFDLFNGIDVDYKIAVQLDMHKQLGRAASSALGGYLQLPEKETRPSVLASTQQHLRLWESDLVRRLTSSTSFDIDAFLEGAPMSIYIIVPPFRLKAYAPLLRLWLATLMSALMTRRTPPPERTLMLCDELGALGAFEEFVTASTLMRSSGLQLWSFWQNPAQLEVYGADAKTLVDNVGVLQFLGARNRRVATELAALVGGVDADTIMEMEPDECMALIEGAGLHRLRKVRYFEHPELRELAGLSAACR